MIRYLGSWSGGRSIMGAIGALVAAVEPIRVFILISLEFILIDFVIGVWASRTRAKRAGRLAEWGFESERARKTIYKLVFVSLGIVMAWQLDNNILAFADLRLAEIFAGFVCGVEFWSFLENAACISEHPIFKWLSKYMGAKVKDAGLFNDADIKKAAKGEAPKPSKDDEPHTREE